MRRTAQVKGSGVRLFMQWKKGEIMESGTRRSGRLRRLLPIAVLLLSACGGGRDDVPLAFTSVLTASQVVPPTGSAAIATGLLTYETTTRSLTVSALVPDGAPTAVQLREGRRGSNGPLVLALSREGSTPVWSARAALTDAQAAALRAENYYLEVQAAAFPAGEIRGQALRGFPSRAQAEELQQYRQQSLTIELQIQQLERILDADDDGISWNLFIRF